MKPNLLFCTERWCDSNPNLAWTNGFHNLITTFSQCVPQYNFNAIHLDESAVVYNQHIDGPLIQYCKNFKPKIIIFTLLGHSQLNPTNECFKIIKEMGIYTCIIWPDTGFNGWGVPTIEQIGDLINLHVSWDWPRSAAHDAYKFPSNYLPLWTPEDRTLFYKPQVKDIPVSFIGSPRYFDRIKNLTYLKSKIPDIAIGGGQREQQLTPSQYAELIRRSKFGISFSANPTGYSQLKGRVFEYISSGALLFDTYNPATEDFFKNGEDYIAFNNLDELVEKINYYKGHFEESEAIANNGYNKFNQKYTAFHFWQKLMERIHSELKQ